MTTEEHTSVPDSEPGDSPSTETSISPPDISSEKPPSATDYEPSDSTSGYPLPLIPEQSSEEPTSLPPLLSGYFPTVEMLSLPPPIPSDLPL